MDNYENLNAYNKENDYDDINYKNRDDIYDNPLKGEYTNDWTEQLAEPDISYWCQDSPEASTLLGKCIKMLNDKNYKTMKTYLDTLEEYDTDVTVGNSNGERINKVSFVKNFYLGIAFFKEGDYDEALNSFNKAKKLFQYYQLHYNLALCYMKKNNLYEAIINLDSVITKNPNFYFAYYNLIKIYLANRNPSQAYVNYRRLSDVI
jgi:tetratricopeptide (TPR) repeat protein